MTPVLSLRPVCTTDQDFLVRLYASTREAELAATDWTAEQKAQFCLMQYTAQDAHYRQHYPGATFDIIEAGGQSAGRLYVDRWATEIRIMDIVLMPDFQRKGIGTHWLKFLQAEAAACRKLLSIHVERFNPALSLYESLGFKCAEDKGVYLLLHWQDCLTAK